MNRILRRRSVVFVISDFQDSGYEPALSMAKRRHDLILIDVADRRERIFPKAGLVDLVENETGRRMIVDTSSRRWRDEYQRSAAGEAERRDRGLRRRRLDRVCISTGESFVEPLVRFFRMREARR